MWIISQEKENSICIIARNILKIKLKNGKFLGNMQENKNLQFVAIKISKKITINVCQQRNFWGIKKFKNISLNTKSLILMPIII